MEQTRPNGVELVMARSRRRKRSSSQRIAGLVALGLPAPMQRVADTRLGSLMMLIFIPAMIISGVLTIDWKNGTPSINIDRAKAKELKAKAETGLTQWSQDGTLQQWHQNVQNAWQQAQQGSGQSSNNQAGWFNSQNHPQTGRPVPSTSSGPPPGNFTGYGQPNQAPSTGNWNNWNSANNMPPTQYVDNGQANYGNNYYQPNYQQPPYPANNYNQPTTNQPAYPAQNGVPNGYGQPGYGQPSYAQPNYSQPGTWQPNTAAQPSTGQPLQTGNNNSTRPAWLR